MEIIIFSILQLINVFFSTIKTVIQIRGNKISATLANSLYYAFYTIVVVFMVASFPIWVKILITFFANLIGTFLSMSLLEHLRKDKLWKIDVTVDTISAEEIHQLLKDVPHSFITITDKRTVFTFYCATGNESKKVKKIVDKYNAKYFVSENRTTL